MPTRPGGARVLACLAIALAARTALGADPVARTRADFVELARFMESFNRLFGGYPATSDVAGIGAAPLRDAIDERRYDGELCPDPLPTLDGWRQGYAYRASRKVRTRFIPYLRGVGRVHQLSVADGFEVRSAGADGSMDTADDLTLTEATIPEYLRDAPEPVIYGEWGLAELWSFLEASRSCQRYRAEKGAAPQVLAQFVGTTDLDLKRLRYAPPTESQPEPRFTHSWRDGTFGTADDVVFEGDKLVSLPVEETPRILVQTRETCGPAVAARTVLHFLCRDMPERMGAVVQDGGVAMPDRILVLIGILTREEVGSGDFEHFLGAATPEIRRKAAELLAQHAAVRARVRSREWESERKAFERLVPIGRTLLRDEDADVAGAGARFLAVMLPDEAVAEARAAGLSTRAVLEAIELAPHASHLEAARSALREPDIEVRLTGVRALGRCGGARAALEGLDDPEPIVRAQALAEAVRYLDDPLSDELVAHATRVSIAIWESEPEPVSGMVMGWVQRHAKEHWPLRAYPRIQAAPSAPVAEAKDRAAVPVPDLVRAWDHRAEPELVAAWRALWRGSTQEALDGANAEKLADLLRGLVLVSGDAGANAIVDTVERVLADGHPSTSTAPLIRAVGLIGAPSAQERLQRLLTKTLSSPDGALEDALLDALRRGGVADVHGIIDYALATKDPERRVSAVLALGSCIDASAGEGIVRRLGDSRADPIRGSLHAALERLGRKDLLVGLLHSGLSGTTVVGLLTQSPDESLLHLLASRELGRRPDVIRALGSVQHPDAAWHLLGLLEEAEDSPLLLLPASRVYDEKTQGPRADFGLGYIGGSRPVHGASVREALAKNYALVHDRALPRLSTPSANRDLQLALMLPSLIDDRVRAELARRLLENPFAPVRYAGLRSLQAEPDAAGIAPHVRDALLADPAPRVRHLAAEVFLQRRDDAHALPPAPPPVARLAAVFQDPAKAAEAAASLGATWDGAATAPLLRALADHECVLDQGPFPSICDAIGQIGDPASAGPLGDTLGRIVTRGQTAGAVALIRALLRVDAPETAERALWDAYQLAAPTTREDGSAVRSLRDPLIWALVELRSRHALPLAWRRIMEELGGLAPRNELSAWPELLDYVTDLEGLASAEALLSHPAARDDVVRERILLLFSKDPPTACRILGIPAKQPWTVEWKVILRNPSPAWLPCVEPWLVAPRGPDYNALSYLQRLRTERAAEIVAHALANVRFDADEARIPLDPLAPIDPYYDLPNKTYSSAVRRAFVDLLPLTARWVPWLAAHEKPGARLQAALLLGDLPADETCGLAEGLMGDPEPLVRLVAHSRIQDDALAAIRPVLEESLEDPAFRVRRDFARRRARASRS